MPTESILDKVQKIIAKAESTTHQGEADAFMAKAAALMAQHSIDQAMLDSRNHTTEDVIIMYRFEPFKGSYRTQTSELASFLGHAFGFTTIIDKQYLTIGFSWVGWQSDIEIAKVLFTSLLVQGTGAAIRHRKANAVQGEPSSDRWRRQRGFLTGYYGAATNKITEVRNTVIKEAEQPGEDTVALAVIDKQKQIKQFVRETMSLTPVKSRAHKLDVGSYLDGKAEGARADVGQSRVAGSGKALRQ